MKVITINEESPYLVDVKHLWRKNSGILGFFPEGAFFDYAKNNKILVATADNGDFTGYLAYRVTKMRAIIVHLCIEQRYKGNGIALKLIQSLSKLEKRCHGIGLHCRRDFPASNFWPKAGFIALKEKLGKSLDTSKLLTFWWRDHGHPTLFSYAFDKEKQTKLLAVIDANIFYDLIDGADIDSEESQVLLADWLQDSFVLSITDELFNEINRQSDARKRENQRNYAQRFHKLKNLQDQVSSIYENLRRYLPNNIKPSDESDIRQLAHAIAAESHAFITRDDRLLAISEEIKLRFNISIIRPCDFIIRLDELTNEREYYPAKLAGSSLSLSRVKSGQAEQLISRFFTSQERKADFQRIVRNYLSNTKEYQSFVIEGPEGSLLGLLVYHRNDDKLLDVPLLRLVPCTLTATLAKYVVLSTLYIADEEKRTFVTFSDKNLPTEIIQSLTKKSFLKRGSVWMKVSLGVVESSSALLNRLQSLSVQYPKESDYFIELQNNLKEAVETKNHNLMLEIEKALWPAKISDLNINNYIVPIKPEWALNLFDEHLATQTLFGSKPELVLNWENVFYRAVKPISLKFPARILWYVSKNKGYAFSKRIRACSYLDEIIIDKPKELYRQFRRLGIYEWNDLVTTADGNLNCRLMALKFSDSEQLKNPLPLSEIQNIILSEKGKTNYFQSPVKISCETFNKIYKIAKGFGDYEKSNSIIYPTEVR